MASAVQVCNYALGRIAISSQIDALDEGSQEAETCSLFLPLVANEVLREYPWPFARKTVALALVAGESHPEWEYVYRYPAECARIIRLARSGDRLPVRASQRVRYDIGSDDAGTTVLTDEPEAHAIYIAEYSIVPVPRWSSDFVSLVSWRLAAEIAPALSQSGSIADRCLREYHGALRRATAAAANATEFGGQPDADYILAR